ncbi:MAG: FtsQ-type POTRA domain-containing protein [Spirochaetales bacterium]|nr:FtsQ-type POTRA domain-containing protein [Spirochaetales bacterium]
MADAVLHTSHRKEKTESLLRKALWGVIAVLLLFSIGEMVFHFFIAPKVFIRSIQIKTNLELAENDILQLAGLKRNEYYFFIDTVAIEQKLQSHPLVKDAIVEKVFPDGLRLTLLGREPLFVSFAKDGLKSVPLVIDESGVLYKRGLPQKQTSLPVFSGVSFNSQSVGEQMPSQLIPVFSELGSIKRKDPALFNLISEIRVLSTTSGGYELLLYPVSFPVKVRIGKKINSSLLRALFFGLHFMQQEGVLNEVDEIDFRTGEFVYRTK